MEETNSLGKMLGAMDPEKLKLGRLEENGLPLTREIKAEVTGMCSYADSIEKKAMGKGLRALVNSLKNFIPDFEALYEAVIQNPKYAGVTREQVKRFFKVKNFKRIYGNIYFVH